MGIVHLYPVWLLGFIVKVLVKVLVIVDPKILPQLMYVGSGGCWGNIPMESVCCDLEF